MPHGEGLEWRHETLDSRNVGREEAGPRTAEGEMEGGEALDVQQRGRRGRGVTPDQH